MRGPDDAVAFFRRIPLASRVRATLVLGRDPQWRMAGIEVLSYRPEVAFLDPSALAATTRRFGTSRLVAVAFQPDREVAPSAIEALQFVDVADRCADRGLVLLDCIVIQGHRWWSLHERASVA